MIYKGSKLISRIFDQNTRIKAVYKTDENYNTATDKSNKVHLLWLATFIEMIKSCYGSGRWLNTKNWVQDTWENN